MSSRDPSINITYGIMTMIYLFSVGIVNTLQIRIYQEKKVIPYQNIPKVLEEASETKLSLGSAVQNISEKAVEQTTAQPAAQQQQFTNIEAFETTTIETATKETTVVDENALTITEIVLMAISIPLAFGFIIGFDCSCPPDDNHVSKIIFCLGVFIPLIYMVIGDIISLLFPDSPDMLNPFLSSNASKRESDTHFFNIQYRKTLCWSIVTLSFIIHFFSVAFRQMSGGGSIGII